MQSRIVGAILAVAAFVGVSNVRASVAFVDFDPPTIPQGPSLFADLSSAQTIPISGVATFSGGVVLGTETNLPALSYGTTPNVYGTDEALVPVSYSMSPITITINPSFSVQEVSFPLFNGDTASQTYTVNALDNSTVVAQQVVTLTSNLASGHTVIDLKASNITSVVIEPPDSTEFDYSIDSVAFNEPVSSAITPGGTPITSSTPVTGGGTSSSGPVAAPVPPAGYTAAATIALMCLAACFNARRKHAAM